MANFKHEFWDQRDRRRRTSNEQRRKQHQEVRALLWEHGKDILRSENFQKTKMHMQHGTVSVHRHCIDVARYSLLLNRKLGLCCNIRDLVRGSLLHDYFLYDWHDKEYLSQRKRFHGFHHPGTALRNADKEYDLSDRQRDIIIKHMWPLSIIPPRYKEAWVVTAADKYCSFLETVGIHRGTLNASERKGNGTDQLI